MTNLDPNVRIIVARPLTPPPDSGLSYIEAAGPSSATKPTERVATGSIFVEVDTGAVFFYSEAAEAWVSQFSFQAGGD